MKFLRLCGNVYRDRKAKPARNRTRHSSTLFRVPLMTFAPQGQPQISLGQSEASPWVKCPPPYAIALKGHNMNLEVFETSSTGTNFKGPWRQTAKQMEKVEPSLPSSVRRSPAAQELLRNLTAIDVTREFYRACERPWESVELRKPLDLALSFRIHAFDPAF